MGRPNPLDARRTRLIVGERSVDAPCPQCDHEVKQLLPLGRPGVWTAERVSSSTGAL